jgi:hypothetical protein
MRLQRNIAVKIIFSGVLSAAICCIAVLATAQSRAAQSDLGEIEAYIHSFVENHGFYKTSGLNGEFLSERDHIVFDGCNATLHILTVGADEPPYKRENVNLRVIFNLNQLDPKVVATPEDLNGNKLPDNREWVIFRTADRSESMMIWRGRSIASAISAYPLQGGANHDESQKLADAFSRAIALCKAGSRP